MCIRDRLWRSPRVLRAARDRWMLVAEPDDPLRGAVIDAQTGEVALEVIAARGDDLEGDLAGLRVDDRAAQRIVRLGDQHPAVAGGTQHARRAPQPVSYTHLTLPTSDL